MSKPESGREVLEEFNRRLGQELLQVHQELSNLGVFIPESLNHEVSKRIVEVVAALAREASDLSQPALAEVLSSLEIGFHSLHTIGVVDNLEKFQQEAWHAVDKLETVLLMTPSTCEETLARIKEERARV